MGDIESKITWEPLGDVTDPLVCNVIQTTASEYGLSCDAVQLLPPCGPATLERFDEDSNLQFVAYLPNTARERPVKQIVASSRGLWRKSKAHCEKFKEKLKSRLESIPTLAVKIEELPM
jgi:hypothetical protein